MRAARIARWVLWNLRRITWFRRHADPRRGLRYWEHLGGGGGFFNTIRIYPDLNLGLVAMGNRTSWDYKRLADALTGRR